MLAHPRTLKRLSTHSGRLERWLGAEKLERLSNNFRHGGGPNCSWYGPPVNLADVPGSVWIGGDGDFTGDFGRGFFASAADAMADHLKRLWREAGKPVYLREAQFGVGFTDLADAIDRTRTGYRQYLNGNIGKNGVTGVLAVAESLWAVGTIPVAGAISAVAPGGTVPTKATTGAMSFNNVSTGTLHLTGADMSASVINNCLMLYDRLFGVAENGTGTTQAVTGVPTRYQSTTPGAVDSAEGNFLFFEAIVAMPAVAHNWTVCLYTDQGGTTGVTLPSVTGTASQPANLFDMPVNTWFAPLATGDTGIAALSQIQMSAAIGSTNADVIIGHPLGVMMFPQINALIPFDWLTVRDLAPRIFDDACLSLFELPKPSTTATIYSGTIQAVNAP